MEKLLLVGAGGFGRVVLEHASVLYDCAFLDDRVFLIRVLLSEEDHAYIRSQE